MSKLDARTDARGRQRPAINSARRQKKPELHEEPGIPVPPEPPVIEAPDPPPEPRRLTTDDILAHPELVGDAIAHCLTKELGPKATLAHALRLIAALEGTVKRFVRETSPPVSARTVVAPSLGDGVEWALAEAGSPAELGKIVGRSGSTVYRWKKVPEKYVDTIARALDLPREKLRPDLYPAPPQ